nr:glycerate kinase [Microlunatus panaciterrae]
MSVVIAPDSFKGSLSAAEVAAALAEGWLEVRPSDRVRLLPQADGGEGTLDAIEAARPDSRRHWLDGATGPDGRAVRGCWLELDDSTAVVELAQVSGLPLMAEPDALAATTTGVGELVAAALDHGCRTVLVGLGGSASTDGGAGALAALGLRLLDPDERPIGAGGAALMSLASVRGEARRPAELTLLTDVTAPLLGPAGAAAVFGPQKGATPDQIVRLEAGLARLAGLLGGRTDLPGMGAAGGIGYGLVQALGGRIEAGAPYISRLSGLDEAVADADVVLSGEGRFDPTSLTGKVVGHTLGLAAAAGARRGVVAGQVATQLDDVWTQALVDLAGSTEAAMAEPRRWLVEAGRRAAAALGG